MGFIIGIVGSVLCILGGFAMSAAHHGQAAPFHVLMQPGEFVTIFGTALMGALIGHPGNILKALIPDVLGAMKGSGINKTTYNDLLGLMASIFDTMRKEGVLGIEGDLSDPHASARFQSYPKASSNHHVMDTLCGALRLFVDGVVNAFDLERLLDTEIETHHEEAGLTPAVIEKVGDSLPGLGIVAAVLGVILTMQVVDQPPDVIGGYISAALCGTMVGVAGAYGFLNPIASKMHHNVRECTNILKTIQVGLVSFAGGAPPQVALEFARKTIPSDMRPTSEELEEIMKEAKKAGGGGS